MNFYKDKVVVVTGGTDGIGKALVENLLHRGAKVATCGRDHNKIHQLQLSYLKYPFFIKIFDLKFEDECNKFINETIEIFGTIDILINNVGISKRCLFKEMDLNEFKLVLDINFWSMVYCTKKSLPFLMNQKGIIVNITSVAGFAGIPGRSAYSASKFAIHGFTESVAHELLSEDVHVMWVAPGYIKSNIRKSDAFESSDNDKKSQLNEETMMTSEDCAELILKGIIKKPKFINIGSQARKVFNFSRFFPKWSKFFIYRFYYKNNKLVK
ncbi:MAG: SDR family oxidoreductase [Alphaproteobacteria bacterium]|nr:SDR family oxidoreductase [Alphaproteobacteria bacterium]